ncbi:GDP dissociation inhibitor-domain-containing protein [Cytidiella melzeri]|nr:GDP dissociation inhibitor-domain-containing protein [Cytidiella melzeri]
MDVDVVVLGTGLSASITAAALSKAGYKVAHLDANPYYGGDDASLSLDELVAWADERATESIDASPYLAAQKKQFSGISYSGALPPQSRQYAVSLHPTIIPSIGPLIDSLIASGVSRYGGFKLLERVAIFDSPGLVKPVPGSKEDVFKNKKLTLLQKRRLMRFLMFAGGEFEDKPELQGSEHLPFAEFLTARFSLDAEAVQVIVYALAFCVCYTDPTLPALQRVRRYLRSTGRYGASSFLVGHYGGLGEIAQGFCRTSAVGGTTYILGRRILSIDSTPSPEMSSRKYTIRLEDLDEELRCDVLVTSPGYCQDGDSAAAAAEVPPDGDTSYSFARCVAIIDRPILLSTSAIEASDVPSEVPDDVVAATLETERSPTSVEVDTAVLVFPPSSLDAGSSNTSVSVLITGEGSQSTPRGKWILYITLPLPNNQSISQTPEQLLRPYLHATLRLASPESSDSLDVVEPLFTLFYMQHPASGPSKPSSSILRAVSYAPHLPEIADSAVTNAEGIFWDVIKSLKAVGRHPERNDEVDRGESDVESFWPPLEYVEENDD